MENLEKEAKKVWHKKNAIITVLAVLLVIVSIYAIHEHRSNRFYGYGRGGMHGMMRGGYGGGGMMRGGQGGYGYGGGYQNDNYQQPDNSYDASSTSPSGN